MNLDNMTAGQLCDLIDRAAQELRERNEEARREGAHELWPANMPRPGLPFYTSVPPSEQKPKASYELHSENTGKRATLYKQIPGADIEEGWYYVTRGTWLAPEPERWHGPHGTKRGALQAARKALGGRISIAQQ